MSTIVPSGPRLHRSGTGAPLGVVVVSYGSAELLRRNLAPAGLPGTDVRVVVVDNFSSAAERGAVQELGAAHGWHVVAMPDNRGFGAACNAGVEVARELGCRTFLFLNPDAVVTPGVVAELRAQSLREPLSLISPRLLSSDGDVVFLAARTDLRDGRVRRRPSADGPRSTEPGDWLCGACMVVHDELFSRIGGYDEDYFLYWEDVDLGYRAVAAGATVVLREDLVAVHDEGGTHGPRHGRAKSALYYRWNCRNRLAFAARNLDRRLLLRWVLATPAVSWDMLLRGGRRQLLRSPRLLWAAVAGSLAGLAIALPVVVTGHRPPRPAVLVVHPGAELYGSDRVLLESVEALVRRSAVTVALPGPGPLEAELEARGAQVVHCPMPVLRRAALRPRGALRLLGDAVRGLVPAYRLLRRHGAGGVYVSTLTIPSWVLLARAARRRVVCHVHEAERGAPRLLRRGMALGPALAHGVVVNSRFSLEVLVEVTPRLRGRSTVLYNGVRGPGTPVPARAGLTGPVRLLFIGRLSARKGPQVAVAALRELVARGVDARLALLGSVFEGYEWFEDELRAAVSAGGLDDRVEFLGFHRDVWPHLAAADVVLVPSVVDEPFGNTAVEAVLAARPLVVSATSGLREAAAGYASAQAVDPARPAAWADAVERVAADWATFRRLALDDAATARDRHAPARYRERLADIVVGPAGGA
ncbi:glycosyltransferase [Blastococcus saxobsidens]|uniref:GT2 family glycosyltransferase n=1 Tax=Blastococcus saxobsidens TaxID=138336 RepID=A0A4Q7YE16_9ACTN|nr:glycosyltransferase [Blastococcus saxobsidens]RZU34449.1 GT2 family glycosyltransferase [Blastococcus saxobsidens]